MRETDAKLLFKEESYAIQCGACEVYKQFRNRHKERVYQKALAEYLRNKGLAVDEEKQVPIYFRNKKVGTYVPDIVVNGYICVELKCKPFLTTDDLKQFWHYLKCSSYRLGYLINFGSSRGVRIVRRVYDTARDRQKV